MIKQQIENNEHELRVQAGQATKRPFIEPEISSPVDVLEATAFFQGTTGNTDVTGDFT